MSDWQVGDLALCLRDGDFTRRGVIYTVSRVYLPGSEDDGFYTQTLLIDVAEVSLPRGISCDARRFRKIRPSAIEHIEALKRLPVEVKEDA